MLYDRHVTTLTVQSCTQLPVVCYDPQYALRLCLERRLDEPCVHIYAAMGLYEESVELALKVMLCLIPIPFIITSFNLG